MYLEMNLFQLTVNALQSLHNVTMTTWNREEMGLV